MGITATTAKIAAFALAVATSLPAWADVKLPTVFSDHMVLLRDASVPVWGKADPGEKVTVTFGAATASTEAGADGRWRVELKGLPASNYAGTLVVAGKNTVKVEDVLVGEVWLGSGQSNMDFRVARTEQRKWCGTMNEAEEVAAARWPEIRMYIAEPTFADEPQDDVPGKWLVCSPETVGEFSAVGYFFARELHQHFKVPVGMVITSFGASTAQAWVSPAALDATAELKDMTPGYKAAVAAYKSGEAQAKYEAALKDWEAASAKAKADGKPAPRKPGAPRDPQKDQHNPSVLYHAMLKPLAPYAVRGVIWYQGESNGYNVAVYLPLMRTLIAEWRQLWGKPELPFLSVQLANYRAPSKDAVQENSQIARVRDVQLKTGTMPGTGWATAVDIGDEKDVHPKNKQEVGRRLALAARGVAYGEKVAWSGPTVAEVKPAGKELRIRFANADGGLVAKGELKGFAVKDAAGKWVAADAKIDGDTVVLTAAGVETPREARYAWADNPPITLYNGAGLPASPFGTDR